MPHTIWNARERRKKCPNPRATPSPSRRSSHGHSASSLPATARSKVERIASGNAVDVADTTSAQNRQT
jgi:hypothetical protein